MIEVNSLFCHNEQGLSGFASAAPQGRGEAALRGGRERGLFGAFGPRWGIICGSKSNTGFQI
jgi:hypothetical protein